MDLKGKQVEAVRDALADAFATYATLRMMVRIELDEELNNLVTPGPLRQVAFELVLWAQQHDRIEHLVQGALAQVPRNRQLRLIALELLLTADRPPSPGGRFEALVNESVPIPPVLEWRQQMLEAERCVCRVEIPRGYGQSTGFLVSPDLVLTNWHVMKAVNGTSVPSARVGVRFDHLTEHGPAEAVYGLAEDWLVDHSTETDLDYALCRVDGEPGREVVDSVSGRTRGWLAPEPHSFTVGEIALILQHPLAGVLRMGAGVVQAVDELHERVIYSTNTRPGSSGGPVFTLEWNLVAIHHYGQVTGNMGIPMSSIWRRFEQQPFFSEFASACLE